MPCKCKTDSDKGAERSEVHIELVEERREGGSYRERVIKRDREKERDREGERKERERGRERERKRKKEIEREGE